MMKLCSKCNKRPAMIFVQRGDGVKGEPQGFCITCAKELGIKPIDDMLKQMNIPEEDFNAMAEQLSEQMNNLMVPDGQDGEDFELGGAQSMNFLQQLFGGSNAKEGTTENKADDKSQKKSSNEKKKKYLNSYCTNLTKKAKDGAIDKIIGRAREIDRVIQILSRRSKNNPCLIGEPGVGKTAIAEGLAQKIVDGEVPARLFDKEIYLLDLTALVAGTQFRGQFESRVKGLIEEIKHFGNIILFIDEVHNMVGAGDSAEGSMNAANILKPALSRGEIQVIGATTFKEYRKYIEKDAALERRFQPVTIEEPSIEQTTEMLLGVKGYYEAYHGVVLSDNIIKKAVILSERYINDRFLPDKAIDLIDEASAATSLRNKAVDQLAGYTRSLKDIQIEEEEETSKVDNINYEKLASLRSQIAQLQSKINEVSPQAGIQTEVTDNDLAKVIELWTGIPASKVKESDLKKLAELEDNIKKHIIGQDNAVEEICAAVRRSRVQINPIRKPASFIFVGPTGVGKTELVKVLADQLFNSPETLIRLDMSEYMEKHSVSKIIGSPPGYVGYDDAGQLTEKVRRKPYSVLLFDEIEKAHPDVLNVLLQILDEGRITDAQGRVVNFENTVIVMTSNAGSDRKGGSVGFGKSSFDMTKEKVTKALEEFLRPEFLGRIDEVIIFSPLTNEDLEKIASLMLDKITPILLDKGIKFKYTPQVCNKLALMCDGQTRGARDLRRVIRKQVEDKISSAIIEKCDQKIEAIALSVEKEEIKINIL